MNCIDLNSVISALIGGGLAMFGTIITIRGTKAEREKEDSRELVPLFYFLNSKSALLTKLGKHPEGVPITRIVTENEIADVRKRFSFASRAITLSEIGDINLFCNQLVLLEETRKDCYGTSRETYNQKIALYRDVLHQSIQMIIDVEKTKGIAIIGEKLEEYISNNLKK